MAKATAQELRDLKNKDKVEKVVDQILDEAKGAAIADRSLIALTSMHTVYALTPVDRLLVVSELERLGFVVEATVGVEHDGSSSEYMVVKW